MDDRGEEKDALRGDLRARVPLLPRSRPLLMGPPGRPPPVNDPPKGATELVGPSLEGPPEGPALSVAATVRVCVGGGGGGFGAGCRELLRSCRLGVVTCSSRVCRSTRLSDCSNISAPEEDKSESRSLIVTM